MINVLFVDDEPAITRSLSSLFMKEAKVFTANSGADALELLRKERLHVLVSDQRMPKMTGVEVLRQALEISPCTTRILLTGYADLEAVVASVNEGEVYKYISKPWNSLDLKKIVAEAGEISVRAYSQESPVVADRSTKAAQPILEGILIIDDDASVASALQSVLGADVRILSASSLNEATHILRTNQLSIVISELKLASGYTTDFISEMKKQYPRIPIVVQTKVMDSNRAIELINKGVIYRYLPKPVRVGLLKISINSAVKQHKSAS